MSRTQLKKIDLFDDFDAPKQSRVYNLEVVNGLAGLDEPTQARGAGISPFVKKAAILAVGVYGFYKVLEMNQLANEASTSVDNVKFKLDEEKDGLIISCACSVVNPTQASVTIGRPVVTLKVGGLAFATLPSTEHYKIIPLGKSSIGTYDFFVSWKELLMHIVKIAPSFILKVPAIKVAFMALKGKSKSEKFAGIVDILKNKIKIPVSILTGFYVGAFGINILKVPTIETPLIEY